MTYNRIAPISLIAILCALAAPAQSATTYKITQMTSGSFDHKWPSINNNGDIVWSQKVGGLWQVYLLKSGSKTPSPIPVPNTTHNRQYPDVDDSGHVVYLEDGLGAGPGLSVIKNTAGTESTIEFSSGNPPGCTEPPAGPPTCTSWRGAGQHFGIAGNGTIISYHDFCNPSCTRTFDVSSVGQLSGTWNGVDYPDINGWGIFVYTFGGSIFRATTSAPNSPTLIASGTNPRVSDGSTKPEIVYLSGGKVISTIGGIVDSGIWADVGKGGTIVLEQVVSGFSQVFVAKPTCTALLRKSSRYPATSCPLITITPPTLPPADVAVPYSVGLVASGGTPPYTWSPANGTSLPGGFALDASTGVISSQGTSTALQTYDFTIQATDSNGDSGTQTFSLVVFALQLTNAGTVINPGDCASISATPSMPSLSALLNSTPPLTGTVTWSLSVKYTGPDTPPTDYEKTFAPQSALPATQPWDISYNSDFIGGHSTLTYAYDGTKNSPAPFVFCINGQNPTPSTVLNTLGTNPWFLHKIALEESNGTLHQFDSSHNPLFGAPHGFGILQLDPPNSELDLFSWKQNIVDGVKRLNGKLSGAQKSWNDSVTQYKKWASTHGGQPPPPANDPEGYCNPFSYNPQGAAHSYQDAIWIKRYNGAAPMYDYIMWSTANPTNPSWVYHKCASSPLGPVCYVHDVCQYSTKPD